MSGLVVELFGGPGGWAEGLRLLGMADVAIELDGAACSTRAAAGHRTIRTDVAGLPVAHLAGRVEGLIASPPCPLFSTAGGGAGWRLVDQLAAAIRDQFAGRDTLDRHRAEMAHRLLAARIEGYRTLTFELQIGCMAQAIRDAAEAALTVEPARWAAAIQPRWIALEQVPPVLPLWEVYAHELRAMGYSAWAGVLHAADFGVPQTRRRAFLLASLDHPVSPPVPTHARGGGETLFGTLLPWVSMADALGWPAHWEAHALRGTGMLQRHGQRPGRKATDPSFTVRANGGSNASPGWVVRTGNNSMVTGRSGSRAGDGDVQPYERPVTEPAPTVDGKAGSSWRLVAGKRMLPNDGSIPRTLDQPAPTIGFGHDAPGWAFERPATTIAGDSRCWPPGHKVNGDDRRRLGNAEADERYGDRAGTEAIRLTITDALLLQSFRPDYPVQGNKTAQFQQVGNAVPPLLAAHVVAAVTGRTLETEAAA